MRTFFFSYFGHKFLETKELIKYCDFSKIKTICEPFAGACGFSLYCILKEKMINMKYIFNDIDKQLIDFLKDVKKGNLKSYIEYYNNNIEKFHNDHKLWLEFTRKKDYTLYEYFLFRRATRGAGMLEGYNKKDGGKCKKLNYDDYIELENIFKSKNVTLFNMDYKLFINKYKNKPDVLLYLDPPYFSSFNSIYKSYSGSETNNDKTIIDNTEMYINILNLLKTSKCKILYSINGNAITKFIYNEYIKKEVSKLYQSTKKKTTHLIISNF